MLTKVSNKVVVRNFINLMPAGGLLVSWSDYDDESGRAGLHTEKYSARGLLRECFEQYRRGEAGQFFDDLAEIRSYDDLKSYLGDILSRHSNVAFVETVKEQAERVMSEKRRGLESTAMQIAMTRGLRIDSFEFIEAVESLIDGERRHRDGMREDGLCIGMGVSAEQWIDDLNYSQEQGASYGEIHDFLNSYCPLLMAQYRERKLAEG